MSRETFSMNKFLYFFARKRTDKCTDKKIVEANRKVNNVLFFFTTVKNIFFKLSFSGNDDATYLHTRWNFN